jgi:hypothetical protein
MKKIIISLSMLLFAGILPCKAQAKYQDIVDTFFSVYEKNPIDAYALLFKNNNRVDENSINDFKFNFRYFLKDLGEFYGYELISSKEIGESYVLLSYILKYDREPIRIKITCYKPKKKWIVQNFTYDTVFNTEIENSARFDR